MLFVPYFFLGVIATIHFVGVRSTQPLLRKDNTVDVQLATDDLLVKDRPSKRLNVRYVKDPKPLTEVDMAKIDTSRMVKKRSGSIIFYTYSDAADRYVSKSINEDTYWEKKDSDSFCKHFEKLSGRADFLDVGANIGTWSIPMALCLQKIGKGGTVTSVEAIPDIARHTAASIHANGLRNVALYNYAVGEATTSNDFGMIVDDTNKGFSRVGGESVNTTTVYATTLEAILRNRPKPFAIKMDIEGFEGHALLGAGSLLDGERRPCLIQVELKAEATVDGKTVGVTMQGKTVKDFVNDLLHSKGYTLMSVEYQDHIFHSEDFEKCSSKFA